MHNKRWFLGILLFVVIAVMANGALAGFEPCPFKDFLSLVEDFRTEIATAHDKLERFDLSKGRDLYSNTCCCKSIPAMQDLVKDMSAEAGIIGNTGIKTKMQGYIQSLQNILEIQQNNRTDKASFQKALNEMAGILDQMEALMK
jgi:hypothetical protein